jgi:hypothetical protein
MPRRSPQDPVPCERNWNRCSKPFVTRTQPARRRCVGPMNIRGDPGGRRRVRSAPRRPRRSAALQLPPFVRTGGSLRVAPPFQGGYLGTASKRTGVQIATSIRSQDKAASWGTGAELAAGHSLTHLRYLRLTFQERRHRPRAPRREHPSAAPADRDPNSAPRGPGRARKQMSRVVTCRRPGAGAAC